MTDDRSGICGVVGDQGRVARRARSAVSIASEDPEGVLRLAHALTRCGEVVQIGETFSVVEDGTVLYVGVFAILTTAPKPRLTLISSGA